MSWQHSGRLRPAVAALAPLLERLGVEQIVWEFNGLGDSGDIEGRTELPDRVGFRLPAGLADVLEHMLDDDDVLPGGWELNNGSYGTITADVTLRDVIVDINDHEYDDGEDDYGEDDYDEEDLTDEDREDLDATRPEET